MNTYRKHTQYAVNRLLIILNQVRGFYKLSSCKEVISVFHYILRRCVLLVYKSPLNQTLAAFYYALANCGRELSFNLLSQRAAAILQRADYSFRATSSTRVITAPLHWTLSDIKRVAVERGRKGAKTNQTQHFLRSSTHSDHRDWNANMPCFSQLHP